MEVRAQLQCPGRGQRQVGQGSSVTQQAAVSASELAAQLLAVLQAPLAPVRIKNNRSEDLANVL